MNETAQIYTLFAVFTLIIILGHVFGAPSWFMEGTL